MSFIGFFDHSEESFFDSAHVGLWVADSGGDIEIFTFDLWDGFFDEFDLMIFMWTFIKILLPWIAH